MPKTRYPKEFELGERVLVQGWAGSDFGTIVAAKVIYHGRLDRYTWGYRVEFEGAGAGVGGVEFVPQGYVRKLVPGTNEVVAT